MDATVGACSSAHAHFNMGNKMKRTRGEALHLSCADKRAARNDGVYVDSESTYVRAHTTNATVSMGEGIHDASPTRFDFLQTKNGPKLLRATCLRDDVHVFLRALNVWNFEH